MPKLFRSGAVTDFQVSVCGRYHMRWSTTTVSRIAALSAARARSHQGATSSARTGSPGPSRSRRHAPACGVAAAQPRATASGRKPAGPFAQTAAATQP